MSKAGSKTILLRTLFSMASAMAFLFCSRPPGSLTFGVSVQPVVGSALKLLEKQRRPTP